MEDFLCIFLSGKSELLLCKSLIVEELNYNMKFLASSICKQAMGLHEPNSCYSAVKISSNRLAIFCNWNHNIKYKRAKLMADSGPRWYRLTVPYTAPPS